MDYFDVYNPDLEPKQSSSTSETEVLKEFVAISKLAIPMFMAMASGLNGFGQLSQYLQTKPETSRNRSTFRYTEVSWVALKAESREQGLHV